MNNQNSPITKSLKLSENGCELGSVDLTLYNGENGREDWVLQANVPVELSRSTLANEAITKGMDWLRKNRAGKAWSVTAHTKFFALF